MTTGLSISGPFYRRLADHGYKITTHSPCRSFPLGTALALHFGDRLNPSADGPQLALRAAVEINAGASSGDDKVMHWTIDKSVTRIVASERMRLALEIDFFLSGDLLDETLRARASLFHRDLRALIEDANATLDHLPAEDTAAPMPGPILRLEARLVGDLFAGRSGFITAGRAPMTARHREASRAGCNWLVQTVLPELVRILRPDAALIAHDLQTA